MRSKRIFADLEEGKKKLVTPLIEKAAFMSIELDELQETIEKDGWISEYQNGANQHGTKRSPEADTYIALSKNYAAIIKQLVELVPAQKRKQCKANKDRAHVQRLGGNTERGSKLLSGRSVWSKCADKIICSMGSKQLFDCI